MDWNPSRQFFAVLTGLVASCNPHAQSQRRKAYLVLLVLVLAPLINLEAQEKHLPKTPNIIFILTDDLGYGDVGVFFQNQRMLSGNRALPYQLSPNLDTMAREGARFISQYCNAPVCAPSRASLLTGTNQGNCSVRDNQFDKQLEFNHTLGTVLQVAGYRTVAVGKWGLQGIKEEGDWPAHPLKRGFDNFLGYMRHMDGHEHYPLEAIYSQNKPIEVWNGYKNITSDLDKFNTTDLWTAYAKKWIWEHQSRNRSQPFFMYLAYDCPHAVLELPTGPYPAGGGATGGMKWLGKAGHMITTAENNIDSYIYPEYRDATYDDDQNPITAEKPWPETFKRYATATRRIDDAVGDIRKLLCDLKIDDNTIIVFTSDNGPSIESYLPKSYVSNQPNFFGSYGPFDGIKRDCWEGGLRVPTIAAWKRHIQPGKAIVDPSMLSDWMATFADAARISAPARTDGVSLLPVLTGKGKQQPALTYVEYYESGSTPDYQEFDARRRGRRRTQMQMLRIGNLAGVRYQIKSAEDDFEIFDVVNDPKETINLSKHIGYDKIQTLMKAKAMQVRHADPEAPRPYDTVPIPSTLISGKVKRGIKWSFYAGSFPWVPSSYQLKAAKQGQCRGFASKATARKGMMVYTGFIDIPADGPYSITLSAGGKAFMRLHQAALIDADFGYQSGELKTAKVFLKAGYHPFTLNYLLPAGHDTWKIKINIKDRAGRVLNDFNSFYYIP
jgi:arylsulfatase A-like enzyme